MIVYHVDRKSQLSVNQIINLQSDITLDNIFDIYNNTFSEHGLNYINQYSDSSVWELCLEFIRLNYFPNYPSRLQSFFCIKTLEEALFWKGFFSSQTNSKINICKIEANTIHEFDVRWITNPPSIPINDNFPFNNGSIATILQCSYKYWNQELTDNPLKELLVELPVKVVDIIK